MKCQSYHEAILQLPTGWKTFTYFASSIFGTTCIKFYQNQPSSVEDMTKNVWCVFLFTVPLLFTYETRMPIFTRQYGGGKCLHYVMANSSRTAGNKFYQNQPDFAEDMTKTVYITHFLTNKVDQQLNCYNRMERSKSLTVSQFKQMVVHNKKYDYYLSLVRIRMPSIDCARVDGCPE